MKVIIAQCTDEKRSGTHRAKDLYMPSDLFKGQRRYCEAYADKWYILSGKYGLVRPYDWLKSYDMHISNHDDDWNEQVGNRMESISREVDIVEIIAGWEEYGSRLEYWLNEYEIDYTCPFAGQRIGTRTKNMIQEARKVENKGLEEYA